MLQSWPSPPASPEGDKHDSAKFHILKFVRIKRIKVINIFKQLYNFPLDGKAVIPQNKPGLIMKHEDENERGMYGVIYQMYRPTHILQLFIRTCGSYSNSRWILFNLHYTYMMTDFMIYMTSI